MIRTIPRASLLLAVLLSSTAVRAKTYFVGPEGAGMECTRATPCALGTGAQLATAGDTVILLDGTYHEPLTPENSGTPDAWITFRADDCSLPIIEGPGEGILDLEEKPSGVASSTGTYLRFVGLVSRYWDSGFTNGWTGQGTTNSNGHFEYINCIGDGNGRTGMVLYSAPGITVRESISAHNGGNPTGSWSSGIQLYTVLGTPQDNIIERNVSFENTDAEKNTDGSGFIVDEYTEGATFTNNIAFANGGSCFRFTRSSNTVISHFSCYHNGMNPLATGPTNPGEFFFTDEYSRSTATVSNTLAAASGSTMDPSAFVYHPEPEFPLDMGLINNLTVDSGATPFFSDPEGANPDFRPPMSVAAQVEDGGHPDAAADVDIGFDPKCIVKRDPQVPFQKEWWTYAIDYDYIRSIGGVAKCFAPKPRTGGADIGAYELSGAPHAFNEPGGCVPGPDPVDPVDPEPAGPVDEPAGPVPPPVDVVSPDDTVTPTPPGPEPVATEPVATTPTPTPSGTDVPVAPGPSPTPEPTASAAGTSPGGPVTPAAPSSTAPVVAEQPADDGCACAVPGRRAPSGGGLPTALPVAGLALLALWRRARRGRATRY